ncbi:MAG: phospholipase D-like domain-containing protein, partial [Candidatus Eremiobacteraeota bacterium]|nr:phospholipase D-like domain-containing protein [Candidatus Eremiobacteraeota bacterium]
AIIAHLNAAAQRHVAVNVHVEGNPARFGRKPDTGERTHAATGSSAVESLRDKFVDGVQLVIENDPNVLLHGKAVVVDAHAAFIATANPTECGFESAGQVLVVDERPRDVAAVASSIAGGPALSGDYVVAGPSPALRSRMDDLMHATADLHIATEDLSDREVVNALVVRNAQGHHDHVLIEADCRVSRSQYQALSQLRSANVDVRTLPAGYMHEKYVDAGDQIYVGSANLTRNGLDEAREIGLVAPTSAFGSGADVLRAGFDDMWSRAVLA